MAEIKHETWQSTAGYPQERWLVMRGDLKLGSIHKCDQLPNWSNSGKYQAMLDYDTTGSFKAKYFVYFNTAVKWIERQTTNIHSWNEINSLLV